MLTLILWLKKVCKQSNVLRHNYSVKLLRCPTLSFIHVTAQVTQFYTNTVHQWSQRPPDNARIHGITSPPVIMCYFADSEPCLLGERGVGWINRHAHTFRAVLGDGGVLTQDATSGTMSVPSYEPVCVFAQGGNLTMRRPDPVAMRTPVRGYNWATYLMSQSETIAMGGKHL